MTRAIRFDRSKPVWFFVIAPVLLAAVAGWWLAGGHRAASAPVQPSAGLPARMHAGATSFRILVADTPAKQEQGLGRRDSLPADTAMTFPYTDVDERCFWMKDMRFNIDMLWLDQANRVTFVQPNVAPATYPQTFCHAARMVVEMNAGQAAARDIRTGTQLRFD